MLETYKMQMLKTPSFRGSLKFLSNMYPCRISYKGFTFYSSEQAYHWCKVKNLQDKKYIISLRQPYDVKKFAKKKSICENWDYKRNIYMTAIVRQKFLQNPNLRDSLLSTEDIEIFERNLWGDGYWGVSHFGGRNFLGRILMLVRAELAIGELRTRESIKEHYKDVL